jgi:hypothetical protein
MASAVERARATRAESKPADWSNLATFPAARTLLQRVRPSLSASAWTRKQHSSRQRRLRDVLLHRAILHVHWCNSQVHVSRGRSKHEQSLHDARTRAKLLAIARWMLKDALHIDRRKGRLVVRLSAAWSSESAARTVCGLYVQRTLMNSPWLALMICTSSVISHA